MNYQNFKADENDLQSLAKPIMEAHGLSFPLSIGGADYLATIEVEEQKGAAYPESNGFWQTAVLSQLDGFARNMVRDQLPGGSVAVTWIEKGIGYIVTVRVEKLAAKGLTEAEFTADVEMVLEGIAARTKATQEVAPKKKPGRPKKA